MPPLSASLSLADPFHLFLFHFIPIFVPYWLRDVEKHGKRILDVFLYTELHQVLMVLPWPTPNPLNTSFI